MSFLYNLVFIFLSILTLNFGANLIIWFDWIQICSFFECKIHQWFWSDRSRSAVSPCLLVAWLWFPWRLDDYWLHINSEPRSRGCHGVASPTLHWSLPVCQSRAFSPSATVWLLLYCHPDNTPKSCSGLLYSSTRGRCRAKYTGKSGSDLTENIKCFTRIHSLAFGVFFIDVTWELCVCVCLRGCVGVALY